MFLYEGKKTVVTGSGRGIGRATALAFAGLGADVVLSSHTESELEASPKTSHMRCCFSPPTMRHGSPARSWR